MQYDHTSPSLSYSDNSAQRNNYDFFQDTLIFLEDLKALSLAFYQKNANN